MALVFLHVVEDNSVYGQKDLMLARTVLVLQKNNKRYLVSFLNQSSKDLIGPKYKDLLTRLIEKLQRNVEARLK